MPKVQAIRTMVLTKKGSKEYFKYVVTVPKVVLQILGWKRGDELIWEMDKRDLLRGFIRLKIRKGNQTVAAL